MILALRVTKVTKGSPIRAGVNMQKRCRPQVTFFSFFLGR